MILRIPVAPDSAVVHCSIPWAWLDWREVWPNGMGLKVSGGNSPDGWCPECVYRVSPRIAPEGAWLPDAEWEDDGLYLPPTTVLNGRDVLHVEPVRATRQPGVDYSDGWPDSGWDWLVTLADTEPSTESDPEAA